ncbi:hypothetical protein BC832DRAFT_101320 [Gaertneriomyces semiglobifer]|nr:hypothetical protein BC832DRAFT_101320 [Gaertneriomyces semiglobifer]
MMLTSSEDVIQADLSLALDEESLLDVASPLVEALKAEIDALRTQLEISKAAYRSHIQDCSLAHDKDAAKYVQTLEALRLDLEHQAVLVEEQQKQQQLLKDDLAAKHSLLQVTQRHLAEQENKHEQLVQELQENRRINAERLEKEKQLSLELERMSQLLREHEQREVNIFREAEDKERDMVQRTLQEDSLRGQLEESSRMRAQLEQQNAQSLCVLKAKDIQLADTECRVQDLRNALDEKEWLLKEQTKRLGDLEHEKCKLVEDMDRQEHTYDVSMRNIKDELRACKIEALEASAHAELLQKRLAHAEKEAQAACVRVNDLEVALQAGVTSAAETRKQYERLLRNSELSEEEHVQKVALLQAEVDGIAQERSFYEQLQRSYESAISEKEELNRHVRSIEQDRANERDQLSIAHARIERFETQLKEQETAADVALAQMRDEVTQTREELACMQALHQALEEAQETHQREVTCLRDEVALKQAELDDLQKQAEEVSKQHGDGMRTLQETLSSLQESLRQREQNANAELEELRKQVKLLNSTLESAQGEKTSIEGAIAAQRTELESLTQQLANTLEVLADKDIELTKLKEDQLAGASALQVTIATLTNQNTELHQRVNVQDTEIKLQLPRIAELETTIDDLQRQREQLSEEVAEKERVANGCRVQVDNAQAALEKFKQEYEQLRVELTAREEALASLQELLHDQQKIATLALQESTQMECMLSEKDSKLNQTSSAITELERDKAELQELLANCEEKVKTHQDQIDHLEIANKRYLEDKENLECRMEKLAMDKLTLEHELEVSRTAQNSIEGPDVDSTILQEALNAVAGLWGQAQDENTARIHEWEQRCALVEEKFRTLENIKDKLEDQHRNQNNLLQDLESKLAEQNSLTERLEMEKLTLQEGIAAAHAQSDTLKQTIQKLDTERESALEACERAQKECLAATTHLDEMRQEKSRLQDKIVTLEAQLREMVKDTKDITTLEEELASVRRNLQTLEHEKLLQTEELRKALADCDSSKLDLEESRVACGMAQTRYDELLREKSAVEIQSCESAQQLAEHQEEIRKLQLVVLERERAIEEVQYAREQVELELDREKEAVLTIPALQSQNREQLNLVEQLREQLCDMQKSIGQCHTSEEYAALSAELRKYQEEVQRVHRKLEHSVPLEKYDRVVEAYDAKKAEWSLKLKAANEQLSLLIEERDELEVETRTLQDALMRIESQAMVVKATELVATDAVAPVLEDKNIKSGTIATVKTDKDFSHPPPSPMPGGKRVSSYVASPVPMAQKKRMVEEAENEPPSPIKPVKNDRLGFEALERNISLERERKNSKLKKPTLPDAEERIATARKGRVHQRSQEQEEQERQKLECNQQ